MGACHDKTTAWECELLALPTRARLIGFRGLLSLGCKPHATDQLIHGDGKQ